MINARLLSTFPGVVIQVFVLDSESGGGSTVLGWKTFSNWLATKLKRIIRREILREAQQNLLTHNAARQALDLYEMRLETLDTRIAKRIMALEARVAELESDNKIEHLARRIDRPDSTRKAG